MLCKKAKKKRSNESRVTWKKDSEIHGSDKIQKTKHACVVEAQESTRKRVDSTLPKDDKDHIAERVQFDESRQFGAQLCSNASSDVNSGRKSGRGQTMGEARKAAGVAIDQSAEQEGSYSGT